MEEKNPLSFFSSKKLLLPLLLGGAVTGLLVYQIAKFNPTDLFSFSFTKQILLGLFFACITVAIRDGAYIYRIWELTDRQLNFRKCFEIIVLWEFGSCITPASIGGITLALFILNKEKINFGKGASILLLASYLDNLAFILVFSSLYFLLGNQIFLFHADCADLKNLTLLKWVREMAAYSWIVFWVFALVGGFLGFSIFVKPRWANQFLQKIAQISFLKKWEINIKNLGLEITQTSIHFKQKGNLFLGKVLLATIVSWCARYALANALIFAFSQNSNSEWLVFSRQYVHRLITSIPLTPGGSGIMESCFVALNCDFLPTGLSATVMAIWRLYNFYFYLLLGSIVLPIWLRRVNK